MQRTIYVLQIRTILFVLNTYFNAGAKGEFLSEDEKAVVRGTQIESYLPEELKEEIGLTDGDSPAATLR